MMRAVAETDPTAPATEAIGERLRRLRTARRLSQRELSEPGVSYAYISRIEAGTRQPSVKALRKLARKLGVSPDYLETGSDMTPAESRELRVANAELALRLEPGADSAEDELRDVLADAQQAGDTRCAIRASRGLGLVAAANGRFRDAIALLEAVVADADPPPAEQPDLYLALGRSYSAIGLPDRAAELWEACLERALSEEPEDVPTHVRYATHLSHALVDLGERERAQEVVGAALDRAGPSADAYTRIRLYWSLARLSRLGGNLKRALEHARRAVALLELTEDPVQLARAHLRSGGLLIKQGKPEQAAPSLDLAERLLGTTPDAIDLAYLRTEQAKCALALRETGEAARRARESLEILGDNDPAEQGSALTVLAEALRLEGDVAGAADAFGRAVAALEQAGDATEAAEAYRSWGRMLREAGRESEALDVLERAAELIARTPGARVRSGA